MNTIQVKYEKQDNYPHDRELILFDRDAFQSLGSVGLRKVNEKYNILCPRVFVMECLAPNRASEEQKRWLFERLQLIENPIVFTGDANTSPLIDIPLDIYYPTFLTSEQIAKNCITKTPITMESVTPEKLISHYRPRIDVFKDYVKKQTELCERWRGYLAVNQIITRAQGHDPTWSREKIKKSMRRNEDTDVKQELSYLVKMILKSTEEEPISDNINRLARLLALIDREINILQSQIQDGKTLTVENYPDLAYPLYIFCLFRYIVHGRQFNTEHLDQSYVQDFRYLHYLNFCDMFITNEKSTRHIVNSIPYDDIRETPVITAEELGRRLN